MPSVICFRCRRDLTIKAHSYDCSASPTNRPLTDKERAALATELMDRGVLR